MNLNRRRFIASLLATTAMVLCRNKFSKTEKPVLVTGNTTIAGWVYLAPAQAGKSVTIVNNSKHILVVCPSDGDVLKLAKNETVNFERYKNVSTIATPEHVIWHTNESSITFDY